MVNQGVEMGLRVAAMTCAAFCLQSGAAIGQRLEGRPVSVHGMPAKTDNLSAVVVIGDRVVLADDEQRQLLVGRRQGDGDLKMEPAAALTGPGKAEFDLEGLAVAGDTLFAIGSHSAARRSADGTGRPQAKNLERMQEAVREEPERKVVFRLPLTLAGSASIQPSSLRELIQAQAIRNDKTEGLLARALGVPGKENGVDIEGLAAEGSTFWVGFRGPVLRHGYAPVLRVNAAGFPALSSEEMLFVSLGGRGIRDLVRLSGGFLVLAGAAGDSDQSTQLVFWDGRSCVAGADVAPCVTKMLGEIPPVGGVDGDGAPAVGRAEGVAVIEETPERLRALVVFDGVQGGAPTEFVITR